MSPYDVELTKEETKDDTCVGHRKEGVSGAFPQENRNQEVRQRTQKAIKHDERPARKNRIVLKGLFTLVVHTAVQATKSVFWNVINKGGNKVSY